MTIKEKPILRTPGPTPVPGQVQAAMSQPMISHRGEEFSELFNETTEMLKPVFGTKQEVYIVTGSGMSVLETAVVNTISPGDEVAVIVTGAFGDDFASICERYGALTYRLNIPWGEACQPETLADFIKEYPNIKVILATYCETSTGVLNPIEQLAKVIQENSDTLFIVDGVSCIGGVNVEMDKWGIDVLVTGSQKAMMLPPGLAFISVSTRTWDVIENNKTPSFYTHLPTYRDAYMKGQTPSTPAVSLIKGVREVLYMMKDESLAKVIQRHDIMKNMTRSAIDALGLPLLTSEDDASPTVTAIKSNGEFDIEKLRNVLKAEYNIAFAGGVKKLEGQLLRFGHMGWCFPSDVLTAVALIELGLKKMDVKIDTGAGVKAAVEVYHRYQKSD